MKILNFGTRGGCDSVSLAYVGYEVDVLDCSDVVLKNLIVYEEGLERYANKKLNTKPILGDILEVTLSLRA